MIEAVEQLAGVLAAVVVPLANRFPAELRDHRRHADRSVRGAHKIVAVANRQHDPLVPGDGKDVVLAFDLHVSFWCLFFV